MKNIGIIAEYNPFHNGHQYQIQEIRHLFSDKKILVIMSGNFVQRGEPAVFNKYLRTKCAIHAGADIVFELPCMFATASAEHFARAAVLSLAATNAVDTLCFGAESDQYELFYRIADLLIEEPQAYQNILKQHLKSGLSYPKARALASSEYLQDEDCQNLLRQPNNILGIEYIKTIRKYHLDINPCIVKRKGCEYHDLSLETPFSSASALRNKIKDQSLQFSGHDSQSETQYSPLSGLSDYIPAACCQILQRSEYAKPLFLSDFYPFLQYALWQHKSDYTKYFEVTGEISNRLSRLLQYPVHIEELLGYLSGKNYTNTRIQRALLNILLKNKKENMLNAIHTGYASYLRILGFRSQASHILKEIKQTGTIPLINKTADAQKILTPEIYRYFQQDIHSSTLYNLAFSCKYAVTTPSEYKQPVIIEDL